MKKTYLFILAILTLLVLAGCSTPEPEKIAFLNMEKILDDSYRAQQLTEKLVDIGNDLEVKYNQKQKELGKGKDGEEELDRISQEYLDNKQRLEGLLNQEITDIISEVAGEKNISTVLYDETIYYGGLDITDEVIQRLDERYKEGVEAADEQ